MRSETFRISGQLFVDLDTSSGDVEILESEPGEAVVELRGGPEETYVVELNHSELTVRPASRQTGKRRHASTNIRVRVPEGTGASVRTASGNVVVSVPLQSLVLTTASGDVRVERPISEDLEARTASGDFRLREVGGNISLTTVSGDCRCEAVGEDLRFNSTSGDVRAAAVGGALELKTVSGDVEVRDLRGHVVRAKTLSGDLRLGVPPGRTVDVDMQTLSGAVINRLEKTGVASGPPKTLSISVKTVSGDLRLENA